MSSRPLADAVAATLVCGHSRNSPPRASLSRAAASPAVTLAPLSTCAPPPVSCTEPCTVASEAKTSPIGCCANPGTDTAANRRARRKQREGIMRRLRNATAERTAEPRDSKSIRHFGIPHFGNVLVLAGEIVLVDGGRDAELRAIA